MPKGIKGSGGICGNPSCDKPSRQHGLCGMHGMRATKTQRFLESVAPDAPACQEAGCPVPAYMRGRCPEHHFAHLDASRGVVVGDGERLCRTCDQVKPVSEFYPREDGVTDYRCKDCTTAGMRVAGDKARRAAGMEVRRFQEVTTVEGVKGQVCFFCGEWKPLSEYYVMKVRDWDGLTSECKECIRGARKVRTRERGGRPRMPAMGEDPQLKAIRQIRFQQAGNGLEAYRKGKTKDPERYRNYTNQRRALELGAPVNDLTGEQVAEMMIEQDGVCSYCGLRRPPLVVEHIVPLARGGSHTRSNVTGACQPCNSEKYNRTPEEWAEARARKELRMGLERGALGVIHDPRGATGWGQPQPTPPYALTLFDLDH